MHEFSHSNYFQKKVSKQAYEKLGSRMGTISRLKQSTETSWTVNKLKSLYLYCMFPLWFGMLQLSATILIASL